MARASKSRGKKSPPPAGDPVDAAMALAAERGWAHVTLPDVAERCGRKLSDIYQHYSGKPALLAAFMSRIDARVLDRPADEEPEASPRDRLFDVVMARFDALTPYKDAVRRIVADLSRDPCGSAAVACGPAPRALGAMLAAAGLEADGLRGLIRRKGLALIYADALRTWLKDDSPDLARTMAVLDKRLRQAEDLLSMLGARRFRRSADEASTGEA